MADEKQSAISLNPEDAVAGGLAIDGADGEVLSSKFTMFDYQGKFKAVPTLEWEVEIGEEKPVLQNWSLGDAKNFIPDADGMTLMKVGNRDSLVKGCNALLLFESLVNVGFPVDQLNTGRSDVFTGLKVRFESVPAPERKGIKKEKKEGGYDDTIIIVTDLIALPGEEAKSDKAAPKGAGKKKTTKAAPKVTAKEDVSEEAADINKEATDYMFELIKNAGEKGVSRKDLPAETFTHFSDHPNRNELVKLICEDSFLANGPWNYADGVCTKLG